MKIYAKKIDIVGRDGEDVLDSLFEISFSERDSATTPPPAVLSLFQNASEELKRALEQVTERRRQLYGRS